MPQSASILAEKQGGQKARRPSRSGAASRTREIEPWVNAVVDVGNVILRGCGESKRLRTSMIWEAAMGWVFGRALQQVATRRGIEFADDVMSEVRSDGPLAASAKPTIDYEQVETALANVPHVESPSRVGWLYERMLSYTPRVIRRVGEQRFEMHIERLSRRRAQGSFYTPDVLVQHVLNEALGPAMDAAVGPLRGEAAERALLSLRVCDPSCGTGNFLLAAVDRIAARMDAIRRAAGNYKNAAESRREVMRRCVYGVDRDPMAVRMCRAILMIESGDASCQDALRSHIHNGDALLDAEWNAVNWRAAMFAENVIARDGFDVVVGNPPFLNQLECHTAASRDAATIVRERSGGVVRGYSDIASAFLVLAAGIARSGGLIALVQPHSLLAARDAQPVRHEVLRGCSLRSLWVANDHIFEASVHTCVPVLQRDGPRRAAITRLHGRDFARLDAIDMDMDGLSNSTGWSHLLAEAKGVPAFAFTSDAKIGDIADVTADFRDQYYGLDGFLVESDDLSPSQRNDRVGFPPLITTGLIDLAHNAWGTRPTRLLKHAWRAPRIDRWNLRAKGDLGEWLTARLVPKILLATQTRVLEVVVDEVGEWVPAVPLLTIVPREVRDIWRIAAAIASPVCTAIAMREYGGTAMSADAIKLAARQTAMLPIPAPSPALDRAAHHFRRASGAVTSIEQRRQALDAMGQATLEAFGVPVDQRDSLMRWWCERRVRRVSAARVHPSHHSPTPAHDV